MKTFSKFHFKPDSHHKLFHMKNIYFISILTVLLGACHSKPSETLVNISTPYGEIIVKLYDSTIKHRENFVKLADIGYFNGTLFHRVIRNFMIQGGDPGSKNALPGALLGEGDTNYTVPFEYVPSYLHKRGAFAAARESDDVNPSKASSASQFYIVQGKVFTNVELDAVELKVERRTKQYILMDLLKKEGKEAELKAFRQMADSRDTANIRLIINQYRNAVEAQYMRTKPFKLTEEQRRVYTTIGGTPHLDGAYTVFGEVVSGMDIVDQIAAVETDKNDRPIQDIRMTIKVLKEK
jgi:cyclophilin family peptidyl-prolyl cis-trans isomerase